MEIKAVSVTEILPLL